MNGINFINSDQSAALPLPTLTTEVAPNVPQVDMFGDPINLVPLAPSTPNTFTQVPPEVEHNDFNNE